MAEIRDIQPNDYYRNHLELYSQLTDINPERIAFVDYSQFVAKLNDNHRVFVALDGDVVVGTITALIECKFIHDMGKVGHIEDVVVHNSQRGKGLGAQLVKYAVDYCKERGCYKTILDCSDANTPFYEKCGLIVKGKMMAVYHE